MEDYKLSPLFASLISPEETVYSSSLMDLAEMLRRSAVTEFYIGAPSLMKGWCFYFSFQSALTEPSYSIVHLCIRLQKCLLPSF